MAADPDFLLPLDVITVGSALIVPDLLRPVAAVIEDGRVVRWLTWPNAELPQRAIEEAEAWPTTRGVWVVYRSDGGDDEQRTAVFVSLAGDTHSVDLGDRRPLGTDDDGLWIGDPRDPSAWMDDSDESHEPELEVRPDTLEWVDVGPFWPERATWTEPTDATTGDEDRDDDEAEDDDSTQYVVSTLSQWSIAFADGHHDHGDDDDAEVPVFEPPTPAATPPTDIVRISPGGERSTVRVNHLVTEVEVVDDLLLLEYHPTGPRSVASDHGAWDVVYEPRQVKVDIANGLPTEVRTDLLTSVAVTWDEDARGSEVDAREERRASWIDRLDLAGVDGASWPLWREGEASAARAIAHLRSEFDGLADPGVMWTRGTDQPQRVRSDYRDVEVRVEGTWPGTEVVVAFEHTAVPFLRLQRRFRVFDDAGHPRDWTYVTIHLEEDIATGNIPPRGEAVDGILEI